MIFFLEESATHHLVHLLLVRNRLVELSNNVVDSSLMENAGFLEDYHLELFGSLEDIEDSFRVLQRLKVADIIEQSLYVPNMLYLNSPRLGNLVFPFLFHLEVLSLQS